MDKKLKTILKKHPHEPSSLINILHDVQKSYGYLPCEVLEKISEILGVPMSKVFSVTTFYNAFSLDKKGEVIIKICTGTACHIRGAKFLIEELTKKLDLKDIDTTKDGKFTVETVNCLGACAMAPLVVTSRNNNIKYHNQVTVSMLDKIIKR